MDPNKNRYNLINKKTLTNINTENEKDSLGVDSNIIKTKRNILKYYKT